MVEMVEDSRAKTLSSKKECGIIVQCKREYRKLWFS